MINKITAIGTLAIAIGTISAAVVLPGVLEVQGANHCLANDWPAESHEKRIKWCEYHGFKTTRTNEQREAR
jgi:long-subunit fatty acid transport protein